jgi:hypothetical protein
VRVAFDAVLPDVAENGEGGEVEPVAPGGSSQTWWLAAGLFFAALALGFLGVWLLG